MLQLAVHLDRPERARALYLLSLALGDLEPSEREPPRRAALDWCSTCSSSRSSPGSTPATWSSGGGPRRCGSVDDDRVAADRIAARAPRVPARAGRGRRRAPGRSCSSRSRAGTRPRVAVHAARRADEWRDRGGEPRPPRPAGATSRACSPTPGSTSSTRSSRPGATAPRSRASGCARPLAPPQLERARPDARRIRRRSSPRSSRRSTQPLDVATEPRRRGALRRRRVALVHAVRGAQPRPARPAAHRSRSAIASAGAERALGAARHRRRAGGRPLRAHRPQRPQARRARRRTRCAAAITQRREPRRRRFGRLHPGLTRLGCWRRCGSASTPGGRSPTSSPTTAASSRSPSTPADPGDAVRAGHRRAAARGRPTLLAHGTTVATNALLERRGGRVALVTTRGFADVIEIARQARPSLYDPFVDRPPPLVPRELRFEVGGRLDGARPRARSRSTGDAARDARRRRRGRGVPAPRRSRPGPRARGRRVRCAARGLDVDVLARGVARVPRVRAHGHDRGRTRRCGRVCRAYLHGARRAGATRCW